MSLGRVRDVLETVLLGERTLQAVLEKNLKVGICNTFTFYYF